MPICPPKQIPQKTHVEIVPRNAASPLEMSKESVLFPEITGAVDGISNGTRETAELVRPQIIRGVRRNFNTPRVIRMLRFEMLTGCQGNSSSTANPPLSRHQSRWVFIRPSPAHADHILPHIPSTSLSNSSDCHRHHFAQIFQRNNAHFWHNRQLISALF